MEYIDQLEKRSNGLMRKSVATREGMKHTSRELNRGKADLQQEMLAIQLELAELSEAVQQTMNRVKTAVDQFRYIVKKGDVNRLQQRVDAWAPEKKISRDEFKKMLEE